MKKLLAALILSLLVVHCGQAGHHISHQDNPGEIAAPPDRESHGIAAPVRTAVQVQLTWDDPNNPTDVGGYKLYYWQDTSQKTAIDVSKQTVYTLTGLEAAQTYNFTVTAYDAGGRESAYSNVVSQTFVAEEAKLSQAQTRGREAVGAPAKAEASSQDYLIGPEDVLEILVWKNADLSRVVTVRPDGKFSLPLVGDVQAAGLTAVQLAEQIIEKLLAYYKERPQVSIVVQQVNSYAFYILGEVRNPGRHIMKGGFTFLQGITLAGGFTEFASMNKILLLRRERNNNKETRMKVRYKDIISGKQDNILLKPGDTIIVP